MLFLSVLFQQDYYLVFIAGLFGKNVLSFRHTTYYVLFNMVG